MTHKHKLEHVSSHRVDGAQLDSLRQTIHAGMSAYDRSMRLHKRGAWTSSSKWMTRTRSSPSNPLVDKWDSFSRCVGLRALVSLVAK